MDNFGLINLKSEMKDDDKAHHTILRWWIQEHDGGQDAVGTHYIETVHNVCDTETFLFPRFAIEQLRQRWWPCTARAQWAYKETLTIKND